MNYLPRRESAATRKFKSSRATELGVAGHQAAKDALGKAAGWSRSTANTGEYQTAEKAASKESHPFYPGKGHVDDWTDGITGIEAQHQTSYRTGKKKSAAKIESNVIDRHKPTEDL
jgi:hypothetical protein